MASYWGQHRSSPRMTEERPTHSSSVIFGKGLELSLPAAIIANITHLDFHLFNS